MVDSEPVRGPLLRVVVVYAVTVLTIVAMIATFLWVMPRLPDNFHHGLRWFGGLALAYAFLRAWGAAVNRVLPGGAVKRLFFEIGRGLGADSASVGV
jgi:hypothetical protein